MIRIASAISLVTVALLVSATGADPKPATESLFAAVARLAPPGPDRGARAVASVESAIPATRAILFHPILTGELEALGDRMPLRMSSLIRAAALWANPEIPWRNGPGSLRSLAFAGELVGKDFVFTIAPEHGTPPSANRYSGEIAVAAIGEVSGDDPPARVDAAIEGRFRFETFGIARFVDLLSEIPRHFRGDRLLRADPTPGRWTAHDDALRARILAGAPTILAEVEKVLEFRNLVDELQTPNGVRHTRIALDVRIRPEGLTPYPALERFYERVVSRMTATAVVRDDAGRTWLETRWEEGRIRLTGALYRGALVSFGSGGASGPGGASEPGSANGPAGQPLLAPRLEIDQANAGAFTTESALHVSALGLTVGMVDSTFRSTWHRDDDTVLLRSTMTRAPKIVATPILQGLLRLAAGDFFEVMAGSGGGRPLTVDLASKALGDGSEIENVVSLRSELLYASTLRMLISVSDRFSNEVAVTVREEQRRFFENWLDALLVDYRAAAPQITR